MNIHGNDTTIYTILHKKTEISNAKDVLVKILSKGIGCGKRDIGHQDGRLSATSFFHKKYNMWVAFFTHEDAQKMIYIVRPLRV